MFDSSVSILSVVDVIRTTQIETHFQAIYNLSNNQILGYEALTRGPAQSSLRSPIELFNQAQLCGCLNDLEAICVESALKNYARLKLTHKLFINLSPEFLVTQPDCLNFFKSLFKRFQIAGEKIVIEITEQNPAEQLTDLTHIIARLRTLGIQFAIDDLGAGFSGLIQWSQIRPDIIKIDRHFARGCEQDSTKQTFLRALLELANNTHALTIVEGIETEQELTCIRRLGIHFAQGFLLCKPCAEPKLTTPLALQCQPELPTPAVFNNETVVHLLEPVEGAQWQTTTGQILKRFRDDKTLFTIPILEQDKVIGIITREELMERFSLPLSLALYENKPISQIMRSNFVAVEHNCPIDKLSLIVTDESRPEARIPIVILQNNCYLGLVSIRSLLKRMTLAKIERAQHSNPLSNLPGNVPIEKELDALLARRQNFHFAYIDLNHFKAYNDHYGYAKGDQVILMLANLLQDICPANSCFVGHIGGDDFVVIFYQNNYGELLNQIMQNFNKRIDAFFSEEDKQKQGYYGHTRSGEEAFYPLISLAIGVVSPDIHCCQSHHHVAELATDAKKQAKKMQPGEIFFCRRKIPTSLFAYPAKQQDPLQLQG
ncbi:GGDEF domain-containing protein [Gayadomonas joobiniege]|uniref:GGDEF domain-containing protein n=1 Tax=Gayadomonas joobiniege TaxID=1234606 RepID=UPI000362BD35|nr:bifunctional diguanylate cyclase/phosphodiesterase [Gayadomonas joobiniege]